MSPVTEGLLAIREARIHSAVELMELITHLAQAGLMAILEAAVLLIAVRCRDAQTELAASAVVVVGAAVAKVTVAAVVVVAEEEATRAVVAEAVVAEATAVVVAAVAANVENH
jgi:hypothetical protein